MSLTPGTRLGAYIVASRIGAGGMGEVYRARDPRLERDVAIKVLADGTATDEERLRRFTLEARAIAALNHPNIITVFDVAEADGVPFIATELVEGETLRERLLRGPLPLPAALDISVQIAEGLAHAHDARIVHRDLKPQNVMIKPDGLVKILDFGLGKILGPLAVDGISHVTTISATPTTAGRILGTAGYMSPEQVTGRHVDGRSDQFAFGAVLYEMLTGRRAFNRDTTIETISSVLSSDPPPIATIAPATPASLVRIVERCLAKRPEDRYGSTRDLVHDLQSARQDQIGTRSGTKPAPVRRRTVAVVTAALAAIVLAALAALVVMRSQSPSSSQIAVLPFTNIQHDPSNDAFADGIVELLTTNLTTLERSNEKLSVVPASDVRRYGVTSAKEARQTFGATLVVSGSVQRSGDTIRLTLNLIDPVTLQQRSARVIDARAENPLALQDQAFSVLAGMLGAGVQPETRTALRIGGTTVADAYDDYIQGRGYLQRYERLENVDNAIDLFRRAVQQDDHFALAHAALGEALWRRYELTKDASLIPNARSACARAIAINDQTAAVHVTLSLIARGTGEYQTAVAEASRALALEPAGAEPRRELAQSYAALGQFDRAEAIYKEAIATRPGDWTTHSALGAFYYARKRYDAALVEFTRVTELTPDNSLGYSNLGGVLFSLRRYEEATRTFEKSVAIKPTASALSNLGTVYFRLDDDAKSAGAFERAVQVDATNYRVWANLGAAYSGISGGDARSRTAYLKAIDLAERETQVNPRDSTLLSRLAAYYGAVGDAAHALRRANDAVALAPSDPDVLYEIAVAYKQLGRQTDAVAWLTRALNAGYPVADLEDARGMAELRGEPSVRRLLEALRNRDSRTSGPRG